MDAQLLRVALVLTAVTSAGATHQTPNFVIDAPTAEIAKQVGLAAEQYRERLARDWLGRKLPNWYKPCVVRVKVGQIGAGGATTFAFDRGHVFGWRMSVQGSLERILDSVLPHEVSHTIFACHFRRPLPRWADEGAATLAEHESEKRRQKLLFQQVLKSRRRIPLRTLLAMKEYPAGMQNVLTLYAEGYSLADFLVERGGKSRYLNFLEDSHRRGWDRAVGKYYGHRNVESLEKRWNEWVMAGSPRLNLPAGQQLADTGRGFNRPGRIGNSSYGAGSNGLGPPSPDPIVRSQNPEKVADAASSRNGKRRGVGLEAPDPRQRAAALRTAADQARGSTGRSRDRLTKPVKREPPPAHISDGHTRAVNAGWVPVSRPRRSRPWPRLHRRRCRGSTPLGPASEPSFSP